MRLRSNLFPITLTGRLILIGLLAIFFPGGLVFAQDSKQSIESKIKGGEYILVVTESRTLNVRQKASSSSPVIGSLLNGSTVPFTGISATDTKNIDSFWYQVEYAKGKLGWISGSYSKKIKVPKKPTISQVAKLDSKSEAPTTKTKTENPENFLRSTDIEPPPVVENKNSSDPIESQGFFKRLFSSKPKQPSKKPSQKEKVTGEKSWANIDGFRSAKFGMRMQEVRKAIHKDFGIGGRKITIINHPTERTQSLAVTIEQLLPKSGKSQVIYVFGYRSKLLTQVNILIGHSVDKSVTPQEVVNSGNILGNYLLRKRYLDDGLVAHARLNDGSVLIFRGKDQKGRMALLLLSDPQSNNKNNEGLEISLNLSYLEKPGQPDIYKVKEGDF